MVVWSLLVSLTVAAAPVRDHDIVVDDFFTLATAHQVAWSPDEKTVVWTESRWDEALDGANAEVWAVRVDSLKTRRLTFTDAWESQPEVSANGERVWFLSTHEGKSQVFSVALDGTDMRPVTSASEGVSAFQVGASGERLYFTTTVEGDETDPWQSMKATHSGVQYAHGSARFGELWELDLETWRESRLLAEQRVITEFAVSPDERFVAMLTTPDEELIFNEGWSQVDLLDTLSGELRTLQDHLWRDEAPSPFGWLLGLAWSSTSDALAFRVDFDGHPGEAFVVEVGGDEESPIQRLQRPEDTSYRGGDLQWLAKSRTLCYRADYHASTGVYCVDGVVGGAQGSTRRIVPDEVGVHAFALSPSGGRTVMVMNDETTHSDVFVVPVRGRMRPLPVTELNPQMRSWKLPERRKFQWTAPDGVEVEGVLELPPGYTEADGPLPTFIQIHGGPTSHSPLPFTFRGYGRTALPAAGWALLSPNYRGSTGYGDEFMVQLIGAENDIEVKDILAGVDALVEAGIADPDRLAVGGWSNGGFLTNCLITQTDRFKAAISGAGVFDQAMQWAIEDTPGHVINYMEGLPWEQPEETRAASPLFSADRITTPVLIHVGEDDPRVPVQHSRALYRALRHYIDVPVELLVYPGEGHSLRKRSHRAAKMAWDQSWLDRHVLGVEP